MTRERFDITQGRGTEYGVIHLVVDSVPEAASVSLLSYLSQNSIAEGESLLKLGAVYVNGIRAEKNEALRVNDYLRIHSKPRRYKKPTDLSSRILEKTADYIMVDKPAGIPVHSQVDNTQENLLKFFEEETGEPLFITHRLDIETTGCLLIARSLEARRSINQLFRDRKIKKNYVAVVERFIEPGLYTHYMKPSFKSPREVSEVAQDGWLMCELRVLSCTPQQSATDQTSFFQMPAKKNLFNVHIELLTGRPQQIRAQLSHLNAPIVGDIKYGSTVELPEPNTILLRCNELIFDRKLPKQPSETMNEKRFIDEGD